MLLLFFYLLPSRPNFISKLGREGRSRAGRVFYLCVYVRARLGQVFMNIMGRLNHRVCACLCVCVEPEAFSVCSPVAVFHLMNIHACFRTQMARTRILMSLICCLCVSVYSFSPPPLSLPPPVVPTTKLPWKSLTSIIEYYYMWKTTDRYVQQVRQFLPQLD